jgi:curved DNA-binding protein CbpA
MKELEPYRVLQVDPTASHDVIAAAYRALARCFHPDVMPGREAQTKMVAINAAWELIGDEARRAAWDRGHRGLANAYAAAAGNGGSGATGPAAAAAGRYEPGGHRWMTGMKPGTGAAGPPPGRPSGSVLDFGRHIGWSIGEIAREDPGYLVWLEGKKEGQSYADEIDATLRRVGLRRPAPEPLLKRRRLSLS